MSLRLLTRLLRFSSPLFPLSRTPEKNTLHSRSTYNLGETLNLTAFFAFAISRNETLPKRGASFSLWILRNRGALLLLFFGGHLYTWLWLWIPLRIFPFFSSFLFLCLYTIPKIAFCSVLAPFPFNSVSSLLFLAGGRLYGWMICFLGQKFMICVFNRWRRMGLLFACFCAIAFFLL